MIIVFSLSKKLFFISQSLTKSQNTLRKATKRVYIDKITSNVIVKQCHRPHREKERMREREGEVLAIYKRKDF